MKLAQQRIGVLGGTFDPIHLAHLRLAEDAAEQLGLLRVLFVPAPNPWRKAGRAISAVEHRLAMVRLAIADNDRFDLSTIELEQDGPTYTARTLESLHATLPGESELYFIMGADALADLPHWHAPDEIVRLARLAVTRRPRHRVPDVDALAQRVSGLHDALSEVRMAPLSISSTELRRLAAAGRSLRYLVPDSVAAYIKEHGLYR